MTKRIIQSVETRTSINHETGEVFEEQEIKKTHIPNEDSYIKIYLRDVNYLHNLPGGLENITYELLRLVNYNNEIIVNSAVKRQIAEKIDKKFNTVNQYITKLVHYDILIRKDTGIYILNPLFYGKGKWQDILKLREDLELNIIYSDGQKPKIFHNKK